MTKTVARRPVPTVVGVGIRPVPGRKPPTTGSRGGHVSRGSSKPTQKQAPPKLMR